MALPVHWKDRLHLKANGRSEENRKSWPTANWSQSKKFMPTAASRWRMDGASPASGSSVNSAVRLRCHLLRLARQDRRSCALFSDSAVKAATNQQYVYVTISRGRKGVENLHHRQTATLREQITRSRDRPLAMGLTPKTRNSWFSSGHRTALRRASRIHPLEEKTG